MAKSKQIRRALVSSLTTLVLCIAMLVGSTYAWFSNNATVAVSKIQAGKCEVVLQQQVTTGEGDSQTTTWQDVENWNKLSFDSTKPLDLSSSKTLTFRVVNRGTGPMDYELRFTRSKDPNGLANDLNIAVAATGDGSKVSSSYLSSNGNGSDNTEATLATVLNPTEKNQSIVAYGSLGACNCASSNGSTCSCEGGTSSAVNCCTGESKCVSQTITVTITLKNSNAENKQISDLAITLSATQHNEKAINDPVLQTVMLSSMPNVYVQMANSDPVAAVYSLDGEEAEQPTVEAFDFDGVCSFRSLDDLDGENPYADYHADVVITADGDMEAESLLIAAYSELFCDGDWLGWTNDAAVEAGEEIRLMQALWGDDVVVSYAELFENDAKLKCALSDLGEGDSANTGTTVKVELRLYEIDDEAETGEYLTIGNYEYTF